jgi:hypothetical protein
VKIVGAVTEKAKTNPLAGAFDLRVGDDIAGNALKQALVTAVSLCRDPAPAQPARWAFGGR